MSRVRFFDPHPGVAGAAIPLPASMKRAVDALSGKEQELDEAMEELRKVSTTLSGTTDIEAHFRPEGWISMRWQPPSGLIHIFRLIRFEVLS